jgi:hypothetical protein
MLLVSQKDQLQCTQLIAPSFSTISSKPTCVSHDGQMIATTGAFSRISTAVSLPNFIFIYFEYAR